MDIADDDDDDYPGFMGRAWADDDADDLGVSITPDQRRAAVRRGGGVADDDGSNARAAGDDESDDDGDAANMWIDAATEMRKRIDDRERADMELLGRGSNDPRDRDWTRDDIIADAGASWFENDEDWYEPEYKAVDAPDGSVLEKVQRLNLRQPKEFGFSDGEYFDLTGYVKDNTDNQFALVLEVAERARERRIEHLESMNPAPPDQVLPPIQQAIVDLALEVETSGGKTSAFLAMREAADRARLRWELQEAAWAWDNYCEEQMPALGVSERAARLLHMGKRVEDAMDFEKDLNMHNADYNIRTR
ncbi:predicted protein [Micromonas commoda]|uniref:Uncharacterized protein n=1 Tax=Micromonas commoda (strain RCC299 / NOUM17 / CCMP2709) TaxID=296587 RepID=C1E3A9_MICCC|nr:predicted protein [Micromonas commoda]ACO62902.1 predicted protein [Micromonas commoda]|eukprot:XP_002501644.1 predicted protein [Micromonas commoda]